MLLELKLWKYLQLIYHVISGFVTEPEDSKDPENETQTSSKKRISKEEYVGIIVDILKYGSFYENT